LLMIICPPVVALADLIVDTGETYTVHSEITKDTEAVRQGANLIFTHLNGR